MQSLKSLFDRKIQTLFPLVLYSVLLLGTSRLVLDSLRSENSYVFKVYGRPARGQGGRNKLPMAVMPEDRIGEDCNVFEGKWVWDNVSYPLYEEESCPYLVKQTTCQRNGRPDSFYKNWRWQPHGCNIPRSSMHQLNTTGLRSLWNQFQIMQQIILYINVCYGSPDSVKEYNVTTAYSLALETWSSWLESNIKQETQKVFFMSMSPTHLWSWEWRPGTDENCFNESYPIQGRPYWGSGSNLEIMKIVHDALQKLQINVMLLNITQLSEYRKDAHTSLYGERRGKLLTKEQRANPKSFADCIHWCLPGVPDAWNQILYSYLLKDYQNFS
ncbi:Protein trichome birefringence-like [Arachis hypogaea]|nr:Protein trichome birefringence-like [Arachis hypogaea]